MDEKLEKALDFSNFTATLNSQKRILLETYHDDLILYYKGGKFSITKEVLTFCHMLKTPNTVLIDDNNTPIQIDNLEDFTNLAHQKYADATNKYLTSYKEISKNRSVEGLVHV